jgi:hypothetical protein
MTRAVRYSTPGQRLLCTLGTKLDLAWTNRMNRSKNDKRELPDVGVDVRSRGSRMLCSLRVVPVSSEHFLGRRYVMELATASRARELRVFRSLELLMAGVAELGLRADVREGLYHQLVHEGWCQLRDIVL